MAEFGPNSATFGVVAVPPLGGMGDGLSLSGRVRPAQCAGQVYSAAMDVPHYWTADQVQCLLDALASANHHQRRLCRIVGILPAQKCLQLTHAGSLGGEFRLGSQAR